MRNVSNPRSKSMNAHAHTNSNTLKCNQPTSSSSSPSRLPQLNPSSRRKLVTMKQVTAMMFMFVFIVIIFSFFISMSVLSRDLHFDMTDQTIASQKKQFTNQHNGASMNNIIPNNHGDVINAESTKMNSNDELKELKERLHGLNQVVKSLKDSVQRSRFQQAHTSLRDSVQKHRNQKALTLPETQPNTLPPLLNRKPAIFFNTFTKQNQTQLSQSIIEEQLEQINQQPLLNSATIYFSQFGEGRTITDRNSSIVTLRNEFPLSTCMNDDQRQCVQLMPLLEKGDEVNTLQSLYDYCVDNENDIVIYIHTKGTYNPSKENDALRNILMKAVTSDQCITSIMSSSCDTCSTQFHGIPAHYPGNFFTGDCSYVKKLIPPKQYELQKKQLVQLIKNATIPINGTKMKQVSLDNGKLVLTYRQNREWMLESPSMMGINRFAMEHWIGSHPDLRPCDVFSPKDNVPIFRYGTTIEKGISAQTLDLKLRHAPGMNMKEFWKEKNFVLHPWFKKAGRLYEYKALYANEPSKTSWFHLFWK